jgi:hypothetical protein
MQFVEPRSLHTSVALHVLALLFAFVGLPAILPDREDPTPLVMTVEVLPIGDISNVKPSDKQIQKEQKAPTPKTPKPVEPSVKEQPKEPPKPKEPTPPKPTESNFDPTEGAEPKPEEKPKDEDEPTPDEFAALLNKLKQENTTDTSKDAKDKTNTEENKTKSDAPYNASLPLSLSETDAIKSQFVACWRVPAGAKDGASLAVRVKIELAQDASVKTAVISPDQQGRYTSDPFFRAAADSALRAVHQCSPLKNLPADKFGSWKSMELNFDPKDML